ncbi:MAG: hypothetical protein LBQ08_05035 [Holosporaceae bacterium]|jgi:hypothetical protein|nr:hypothetical protein [Holosporaceae bacterium]
MLNRQDDSPAMLTPEIKSTVGIMLNSHAIEKKEKCDGEKSSSKNFTIKNFIIYSNNNNKSNSKSNSKSDEEKKNSLPKIEKPSIEISDSRSLPSSVMKVQDMLQAYNEELEKDEKMTRERARFLGAARNCKFKTMGAWRAFLRAIKKSWYLTRRGFQLCLDWLLRFRTIDRILRGEFGVKIEECPERLREQDPEEHIASLDEDPECLEIRKRVLRKEGEAVYLAWFTSVSLVKRGGVIVISGSPFAQEYVQTHFLRDFPKCITEKDFSGRHKENETDRYQEIVGGELAWKVQLNAW